MGDIFYHEHMNISIHFMMEWVDMQINKIEKVGNFTNTRVKQSSRKKNTLAR